MQEACLNKCGQNLTRIVTCINPFNGQEMDETIYCLPESSGAGPKPSNEIKCPPCSDWEIQYGPCEYIPDAKSCRPGKARKPIIYTCNDPNGCNPKPDLQYEECTMPCEKYLRTTTECVNQMFPTVKCEIGDGKHKVSYSCPFDPQYPETCESWADQEDANQLVRCYLPVCLAWDVKQEYPGCRLPTDKTVEQKCGTGKEYYEVSCPQEGYCAPFQKPSATKDCSANNGCAWKTEEWN